MHLDAGYHSGKTRGLLDELGCPAVISENGTPLQAGARWVVERTNSWHNRGFKKLLICTERRTRIIDAFIAPGQRRDHHPPAPSPSLDHPPLGHPTRPPT